MRASHPYNCSCNRCRPRRKKKKTAPLDSGEKQTDKPELKPKRQPKKQATEGVPPITKGNNTFKWHESRWVAFFSPARWFLIVCGIGLFYLAMWHHAEIVEFWPEGRDNIVGVGRLEMILLGISVSLVGIFAANNWGRTVGVFILSFFVIFIAQLSEDAAFLFEQLSAKGSEVVESAGEAGVKVVAAIKENAEIVNQTVQENAREIWNRKRLNLAGARGNTIFLNNNPDAKDPTWAQLVDFLKRDDTDQIPYDYNSFVCADFAHRLHDNAEKAGWRCYYVGVKLGPSPDRSSSEGHALNAFKTTDRGLVYIDCTGPTEREEPRSGDTTVKVVVGQEYLPKHIFPSNGWNYLPMGKVLGIDLFED